MKTKKINRKSSKSDIREYLPIVEASLTVLGFNQDTKDSLKKMFTGYWNSSLRLSRNEPAMKEYPEMLYLEGFLSGTLGVHSCVFKTKNKRQSRKKS